MSGKWKGKKVAVLLGGISKEREISIRTGTAISQALRRAGCDVVEVDVGEGAALVSKLAELKPDAAVVALHGKFGEDGCVQGLLEMVRVPYTGGGVMASAVGMDKVLCKSVARQIGLPCLPEALFDSDRDDPRAFSAAYDLGFPAIVKPSREGSTINMNIVEDRDGLVSALDQASDSDNRILVEPYVKGIEVTVGIINGEALPTLEIAPKSGFYDYKSKYTKGMTEYIVPARIPERLSSELMRDSERLYRVIECEGTARADFIVSGDDEAWFLEINTVPGMTELSLVPKAAAFVGISFDELCLRLLDGARLKVNV